MRRKAKVALLWGLTVGGGAVALHWAGRGALAGPSLADPGQWMPWLDARGPAVAAFSLLRLAALGGLWYLAAVTAVGAVLRVLGATAAVRVADRITIGPVRRMLAGGVGLGLAASGIVGLAAPAVAQPATSTSTTTTSTTTSTSMTVASSGTVTMHRLSPAEPVAAAPVPQVAAAPAQRWTVKPGQCFWSIAESVLTERWGRPPTDAEIVPYWHRLIDANRHELAQRDVPDLIFPGQEFVVPAL